jgi:hypothetical protein
VEPNVPTTDGSMEWEADRLLEMAGHDLLNQQQAALGFLELLEGIEGLSDGERALVGRTVEALEQTGRLLLQMRTALVHRTVGETTPILMDLDRATMTAARAAEGAFARDRLTIDAKAQEGQHRVTADHMLPEMLTQLLVLLSEPAPHGRTCRLDVSVASMDDVGVVRIRSEGFALDPMVTEALTGDRRPHGHGRDSMNLGLVCDLLERYGGVAKMESAPPGGVGAHLLIELPGGGATDAVDNDSR